MCGTPRLKPETGERMGLGLLWMCSKGCQRLLQSDRWNRGLPTDKWGIYDAMQPLCNVLYKLKTTTVQLMEQMDAR